MEPDEPEVDVVTFRPNRRRLLLLAPVTFLGGYGALTLVHELLHHGRAGGVEVRLVIAALLTVLQVGNSWLFRYRYPWLVRTSPAGLEVVPRSGGRMRIPWESIAAVRLAGRWGGNRLEIILTREALIPEMDDPWTWLRLTGPGGLVVPLVPLVPGVMELGTELNRRMAGKPGDRAG